MHLTPSDPDIATIVRKIEEGRLDLQPNFQRGEVWGKQKKQRLIDSILRGWHIPPIHVIQVPNSNKQEVLDGQQRLAAIRDFFEDLFPIDGSQEPKDERIASFDGKYFSMLDKVTQASIEDFTIRILTISDYALGEPGELFYRLNQPTNLTSAEQRNAYFGQARQQVKELVELFGEFDFNTQTIGFSNSRMAYDDVIAKCLITIECDNLSTKITSNLVTSRYRDSEGFNPQLIDNFKETLNCFNNSVKNRIEKSKLNKATLYSWLLFYYQTQTSLRVEQEILNQFFDTFEKQKLAVENIGPNSDFSEREFSSSIIIFLIDVFIDRSSSRVSDVSSVKLRDFILWKLFLTKYPFAIKLNPNLKKVAQSLNSLEYEGKISERDLLDAVSESNWEGLFT